MKIINILLIVSCLTACNENKSKLTNDELCIELHKMHLDDQLYRGSSIVKDPFFSILDSLIQANKLDRNEYSKLSKDIQLDYGRKARELANKIKSDTAKIDSLMDLQRELDIKNTEKLIKIINIYGYPDIRKLNCKEYSIPVLIFVHSPKEYWGEIKLIIDKERNLNRMTEGDYKYISWHINNRKGTLLDY